MLVLLLCPLSKGRGGWMNGKKNKRVPKSGKSTFGTHVGNLYTINICKTGS